MQRLMYCFVESGWETFSRSFTAQAISLAFSQPSFGQFWVCAATRASHTKKPLPFTNGYEAKSEHFGWEKEKRHFNEWFSR